MKKLNLIFAATFLMPALSQAAEKSGPGAEPPEVAAPRDNVGGEDHRPPHPGFCKGLNLDEEQQKKMKDAHFKFREEEIKLEAKVKEARLNYEKVLSDATSNFKSARAASDEVGDAMHEMMKAHQLFKVKVAYEILKPEQRAIAAKCEEHMGPMRHDHDRAHHEHDKR